MMGALSASETWNASSVLPVPGSPLMSRGRSSVIDALTAIFRSSVAGYLMSAAVIYLCGLAAADGLAPALEVAFLAWLAAFPILVANHLFIKLDWHILVSHALGWLTRMLLAGAAAAWLFGGWL